MTKMMRRKYIYRVYVNDEVVAVFKTKQFALDFVNYQETISDETFEIEEVPIANWLLQPREF